MQLILLALNQGPGMLDEEKTKACHVDPKDSVPAGVYIFTKLINAQGSTTNQSKIFKTNIKFKLMKNLKPEIELIETGKTIMSECSCPTIGTDNNSNVVRKATERLQIKTFFAKLI